VFPTELWPPLELVEATLDGSRVLPEGEEKSHPAGGRDTPNLPQISPEKELEAAYLLLPLTELAQRRAAVAAKAFSVGWASGRLVQMTVNGAVLGVLLDRVIQGKQWTGWIAANESNWASAFDVLLEPCDDPFEPMFGVIQAWNPVTLYWSDDLQAKTVCEVSAVRLAAIRAVALECAAGLMIPTPSEPGRIALRTAGGTFSVLTGTPLGPQDVRHAYQNAYRTVAARLMAQQLTQRVSQIERKNTASRAPEGQAKSRVSRTSWESWFEASWYMRPALVLMTAIVLFQNMDSLSRTVMSAFDGIASVSPSLGMVTTPTPSTELRVQWKPGASMDDVQQLLRATSTVVVDGPDVQGFYRLRSNNVLVTRSALNQSGLVRQLLTP
jgi:hypothetical protein